MYTTGSRYRAAVVPTNFRACLKDCLDALLQQAHRVILIDTGGEIPEYVNHRQVTVITDRDLPLSISRWWNKGIDFAAAEAKRYNFPRWDVAVVNDDVVIPPRWFVVVGDAMRSNGAVAGCSGGRSQSNVIHRVAEPPADLFTRMQGFAFVLAGESNLRADEQFVWWCGDDDIHIRAASLGGMIMIPGLHVEHRYPNGQMTPEFQVQAGLDVLAYEKKWSRRPW